jgi:pilus assembly protein CpaF
VTAEPISDWPGRPGTQDVNPDPVDWTVVGLLRRKTADRLSDEVVRRSANGGRLLSWADQRVLGRSIATEEVEAWVDTQASAGEDIVSRATEAALTDAVFYAIFGLGRLQPLLDDASVENIDVDGHDHVWVSYSDGRVERSAPVAESDAELIELVQGFAAWLGHSARDFSSARPLLNLRLPDGSRMTAWMGVSERPGLTIRRHRLSRITLDDLVGLGTLSRAAAEFLASAVRARKNIIVTGGLNAGKTTLLRALAAEFDPNEKIVVIEKEAELGLDRLPDRHPRVVSLEAREANSEGAGEVTLATLVVHALRMNARRILVGEVRGDELLPMLTAMSTGNPGSLCTLHANSSGSAVNRMVAIGLVAPQPISPSGVHALVSDAVDLIVHITLGDGEPLGGARRQVSSIREILEIGEEGRVTSNEVFRPDPDGRAIPAVFPRCLRDLQRHGFDATLLDSARAVGEVEHFPPVRGVSWRP